jgi:hypothetical protein
MVAPVLPCAGHTSARIALRDITVVNSPAAAANHDGRGGGQGSWVGRTHNDSQADLLRRVRAEIARFLEPGSRRETHRYRLGPISAQEMRARDLKARLVPEPHL